MRAPSHDLAHERKEQRPIGQAVRNEECLVWL